ncbi:MAG: VOC family protein [Nocardioidaceae bacterium]|nr:VOC family protein [Nocardioidaceae bacterium]
MTLLLDALSIDARDPVALAGFWAGLLGREVADDPGGGVVLAPVDHTGFAVRFVPGGEPGAGPNVMHPDLTSTSLDDQRHLVDRALALGARHLDVGQRGDEGHVVLADPEGNELCVLEPGNRFLAGCGLLGALAGDGSRAAGRFWSAALGWPLVWDQDEETAVQSPLGGPKITWGGPPVRPGPGRSRWHLDLVPSPGSDQRAEVERLVDLGATHVDAGPRVGRVVLADPDGHALCVLEAP